MDFSKSTAAITDFADSFIPAPMKADRDRLNQARVFLISHIFGPFIGSTVPLALYVIDPTPGYEIVVLALSILGFWAFPPLLKLTGRYRLLAILSVQNLMFCILWSCYFYGGITSPTLPWVLIIPLLAFFYIGSSAFMRLTVIGLFVATVAAFLTIYWLYPPEPNGIPLQQIENLGIVSMVATSLYVAMMAMYFAKVYESQSELEALVREHLATAADLRQATASAERAGAAKADFLAKMSRELRTPLNAIIGYSQMLRDDAVDEGDTQTTADLDRIHDAGVHLLKLINEILDLAKIDAGKMEIFEEAVDAPELIRAVVDSYREEAKERGNVISVTAEAEVGCCIFDRRKLQQIFAQVVENAVKFTRDGLISVHISVDRTREGPRLSIAVQDTGCGIAPDDQSELFEHFTVLGDSSSSKYGGTGLGLALSRRLCRLMKGDIVVRSQLSVGSVFTITLPYKPAPAHDAESAVAADRAAA